jgi:hypothetical protein
MPFTTEQFINVFREYNLFAYPLQIILLIFGTACTFFIHLKKQNTFRIISIFIVFLWLWTGYIYFIKFFSVINNAAIAFGVLFIIQGILFFIGLTINNKSDFKFENKLQIYSGYFFVIFGLIIYPLIGLLSGKSLYATISLGLPCPTLIYTFGILILAGKNLPKYLLIIPVLWAFIGFFAAIKFGVYQDVALPVSALTAVYSVYFGRRNKAVEI